MSANPFQGALLRWTRWQLNGEHPWNIGISGDPLNEKMFHARMNALTGVATHLKGQGKGGCWGGGEDEEDEPDVIFAWN